MCGHWGTFAAASVAKTKNVIPEVQLRAKTPVSSEEAKKPNAGPPRDLPLWFIISDRQVVQKVRKIVSHTR